MTFEIQRKDIIDKCPYKERSVGYYPAFLIDPCILPLENLSACKAEGYGKYQTIMLSSPQPLPHGHYARLIIAYLTTQICRRPELPSHTIAHSVSELFKIVTGQNQISGGTYAHFLNALERVFDTTFEVVSTNKSKDKMQRGGFFAEADNSLDCENGIGHFNAKYKQVTYTPSNSFRALITDDKSVIPVDLRFLQLARRKNIVLVHDLYIYLVRRCYGENRVRFVPWKTLHNDIFPYVNKLSFSRFKRRFIRALDFINFCHPHAKIIVDQNDKGLIISSNSNLLRGKG